MILTIAAKNHMLSTLNLTKVSLHSGDPGSDGGNNEVTTIRGKVLFAAAVGGRRVLTADVTILLAEPATVTHIAYWQDNTFVLAEGIAPVVFTEPSNFILQATNTYIEI
ncbi:MAG: hypothetical protein ACRCUU_09855 [Plesiomonas sp.]